MTALVPTDESQHVVDPTAWLRAQTDGIVCFGGVDWWYHNRGHYDLQMMRELSASVPVLYVNSIGMRTPDPREGRRFVGRVSRKLRSLCRGLREVHDNFWVLSPPVLPGPAGARRTRTLLTRSVRAGARRAGITRPLAWIACPTAAPALGALAPAAVVYQRTDRYECYRGVDADALRALDARLKTRADLTVFCARTLFARERDACRDACLVEHGVDAPFFDADRAAEPDDVRSIPHPRVGFVGGIDAHTFDPDLFNDVARRLPDVHFVLVGACSLPAGSCDGSNMDRPSMDRPSMDRPSMDRPNVHHLGRRAFADVPAYLAACDVLIMPWNRSPWIEGCSPVKLREYLASGRPIVSTPFPELRHYGDLVHTAPTADAFAAAIRTAIARPGDAELRRARVRNATWADRSRAVLCALAETSRAGKTEDGVRCSVFGVRRTAVPSPEHRTPNTEHREPARAPEEPSGSARPLRLAGAARPHRDAIDLAAFVLLAGGLRRPPLVEAAQRSVLDLWLTPAHTVLDTWIARWRELDPAATAPMRIIHDENLPAPCPPRSASGVTIEREPRTMRGAAGLLRDVCAEYEPGRHVIVGIGAAYLEGPLDGIVETHERTGAAVTLAVNRDGTPAGIYIVRIDALRSVADAGFVDLKEQWLPRLARKGVHVQVHRLGPRGVTPLRTRGQFLAAARRANGARSVRVICPGALVAPGAVITDSIVMPGAMVQRDAIVTRSILCPDARVAPAEVISDAIVRPGGISLEEPSGRNAISA